MIRKLIKYERFRYGVILPVDIYSRFLTFGRYGGGFFIVLMYSKGRVCITDDTWGWGKILGKCNSFVRIHCAGFTKPVCYERIKILDDYNSYRNAHIARDYDRAAEEV